MSNSYVFASSFACLPEASRLALRAFLDGVDSASPYQDPLFFGGGRAGEVDLVVERGGQPVFFALCYENPAVSRFLPALKALVVHKGPASDDADSLVFGLKALKKLAQERHISEICISPQIDQNKGRHVEEVCADLGFRPNASAVPKMTLILNVTRDIDKIIARFHKSTRYEVVRAGRLGITVRRAENEADFMHFFDIYSERAAEKGFSALSIADFTALSERIRENPERSALFLSEYRGDLLAGAVVMRAGPRVHYIYGGTDGKKAGNLPGLYPIFRHAIEWAKEIGCTEFDFGGYGPSGPSSVRRFKEGFGGEVRNFGPAYSLTLMPLVPKLRRAVGLFRS